MLPVPVPTWMVAWFELSSAFPRPISTPIKSIPPSSAIPITAASGDTSAGRPDCAGAAGGAPGSTGGAVAGTRGAPRRAPQERQ